MPKGDEAQGSQDLQGLVNQRDEGLKWAAVHHHMQGQWRLLLGRHKAAAQQQQATGPAKRALERSAGSALEGDDPEPQALGPIFCYDLSQQGVFS